MNFPWCSKGRFGLASVRFSDLLGFIFVTVGRVGEIGSIASWIFSMVPLYFKLYIFVWKKLSFSSQASVVHRTNSRDFVHSIFPVVFKLPEKLLDSTIVEGLFWIKLGQVWIKLGSSVGNDRSCHTEWISNEFKEERFLCNPKITRKLIFRHLLIQSENFNYSRRKCNLQS